MPKARRTVGSRLVDALLTTAATGGLVCIVAAVAAVGFDLTLIMFTTGSMAPTIPAGSLSLVRQIPATEIRVGDVVTIDRANQLPITHRVTSVEAIAGDPSGNSRTITMRGDANATDDAAPYTVTEARIVVTSVPGLAYAVAAVSHPLVLGASATGAAALVAWAYWPRGGQLAARHSTATSHRAVPRSPTAAPQRTGSLHRMETSHRTGASHQMEAPHRAGASHQMEAPHRAGASHQMEAPHRAGASHQMEAPPPAGAIQRMDAKHPAEASDRTSALNGMGTLSRTGASHRSAGLPRIVASQGTTALHRTEDRP